MDPDKGFPGFPRSTDDCTDSEERVSVESASVTLIICFFLQDVEAIHIALARRA